MDKEKTVRRSGSARRRTSVKNKPSENKGRRPAKAPSMKLPDIRIIGGAVLVVALIVILVLVFRGCGVSHKTPEGVVRALVESYGSGSERKIRDCYGVKKADDDLQNEITATIEYFKAHDPEKIEISDCNIIYEDGDYTYVYIVYGFNLKNGETYPCISTYMTQKKDGKYYVLSPSEITDELSTQAAEKYASFMQTDAYKDYVTAYETFTKKNPGYEEKFAAELN